MSSDTDLIPIEACVLPGSITVTDRALKRAKQFQDAVPSGWISTFFWCDGRQRKTNKDAPWEDEGPGLDLGAYRNEQIPEEALFDAGSFQLRGVHRKSHHRCLPTKDDRRGRGRPAGADLERYFVEPHRSALGGNNAMQQRLILQHRPKRAHF